MLCQISDLIVEVPAVGDMVSRCGAYRYDGDAAADIVIRPQDFRPHAWPGLTGDSYFYMETGSLFHRELLRHSGMQLHASAVVLDGKAYLFSAPSGTGKSTHTRLWQQLWPAATVINDDKPALRCINGVWYAYGTPWCGKDGINVNTRAPLAGICFLKQADHDSIRRLSAPEAVQNIIYQTMRRFKAVENLDLMLSHVDSLVRQIPVFQLENRPTTAAAQLSYSTMSQAAQEAGL